MSRFLKDIASQYLMMGSTNSAPTPTRKRVKTWDDDFDDRPRARNAEAKPRSTRTTPAPSAPTRPTPIPRHDSLPAASGNFTIHTADELIEGCTILHQRFGRGTVTTIDTSGSDAKIDVLFADGQPRKLLLKFAKFEILSSHD
jgi:DNA helicase-2/ATP-dependent DNA helicase PcrA